MRRLCIEEFSDKFLNKKICANKENTDTEHQENGNSSELKLMKIFYEQLYTKIVSLCKQKNNSNDKIIVSILRNFNLIPDSINPHILSLKKKISK